MEQTLPFAITLLMLDGLAEGMKIIEKSNWNGCGLFIPRSLLGKHKNRPELQKPGVYLLLGDMDVDPKIYIGEGDPLLDRIQSHDAKKDFWDILIAFTSKDHNLNKAAIQYIESRLIKIAQRIGNLGVLNGNFPKEPTLSEMDRAVAEGYLQQMLCCLPILGVSLSESSSTIDSPTFRFTLESKGIQAHGEQRNDGSFWILKGSQASTEEQPSCPLGIRKQRKQLIDNGVLVRECNYLLFNEDCRFTSPSTPASIVLGRSANGRSGRYDSWKNADEKTLQDLEDQI
jgi:Domain of unknown function (DUF4357)